jgi:phytoene desaturase
MTLKPYDVAVIGAGLGGLCAAALLAHRGYRVLLAESREQVGGRFSTIEQEGFKTPTGGVAIQTRSVLESIYAEVGAPFAVREVGNTTAWLWGEWQELPERGQIRALLEMLEKTGAGKTQILGRLAQGTISEKVLGAFKRGGQDNEDPASKISFRDWLLKYTDNQRVLEMFHALTSVISTVNDFEYPASHWFTYVSPRGQGGMPYHGVSIDGNLDVAEELAQVVNAHGGDVWRASPVTHLELNQGAVAEITVDRPDGPATVTARVVISDLGPKATVKLCDSSTFPADYLTQVEALRAAPIVANLIASDRPMVKSSGGLLIIGAQRIVAGMPMTNFCPHWAPPGQHLTVVWGTPASCLEKVDAEAEKKINLEDIKRVFPDFEKHGRILRQDVRDIDDEFPALRSWMGYDLPPETPLANLYHVGDAVKPFGWEGLAACAQGGKLVAEMVTRKYKPGASAK